MLFYPSLFRARRFFLAATIDVQKFSLPANRSEKINILPHNAVKWQLDVFTLQHLGRLKQQDTEAAALHNAAAGEGQLTSINSKCTNVQNISLLKMKMYSCSSSPGRGAAPQVVLHSPHFKASLFKEASF